MKSYQITAFKISKNYCLELRLQLLGCLPNISNFRDEDSLDNGDLLIQKLKTNGFNLILHGHKHQPRFKTDNGIPILASGSFSCYANLFKLPYKPSFHVIDIINLGKQGVIETWEFDVLNGWKKNLNADFPPKIGFGNTINIEETVELIFETLSEIDNEVIPNSQILKKIPDLEYIIPTDLTELGNQLKEKYNIICQPAYPLEPNIIELNKTIQDGN